VVVEARAVDGAEDAAGCGGVGLDGTVDAVAPDEVLAVSASAELVLSAAGTAAGGSCLIF
jgi:hypothetical protein